MRLTGINGSLEDAVIGAEPGEYILWSGRPGHRSPVSMGEVFIITIGVVVAIISTLWIYAALFMVQHKSGGSRMAMLLCSLPMLVVVLSLLVIRPVKKKRYLARTRYFVTNKRVVKYLEKGVCKSVYIRDIPSITVRNLSGDTGTIEFGSLPLGASLFENTGLEFITTINSMGSNAIVFHCIDEVEKVRRLVAEHKGPPLQ